MQLTSQKELKGHYCLVVIRQSHMQLASFEVGHVGQDLEMQQVNCDLAIADRLGSSAGVS
jgi:hypothetical protein